MLVAGILRIGTAGRIESPDTLTTEKTSSPINASPSTAPVKATGCGDESPVHFGRLLGGVCQRLFRFIDPAARSAGLERDSARREGGVEIGKRLRRGQSARRVLFRAHGLRVRTPFHIGLDFDQASPAVGQRVALQLKGFHKIIIVCVNQFAVSSQRVRDCCEWVGRC